MRINVNNGIMKTSPCKDKKQGQGQGLHHKDQDKDKDLTHKDKNKDLTPKDQYKDKDLKYVLKDKGKDCMGTLLRSGKILHEERNTKSLLELLHDLRFILKLL